MMNKTRVGPRGLAVAAAVVVAVGCGTNVGTPASTSGSGGAVASTVGAGGGSAIATGGTGGTGGSTSAPEVGAVFLEKNFDVKVSEDVVFAQGLSHSSWGVGDGEPMDLLLDVYEPIRVDPEPMPVVVVIHGGGFVGGSKEHEPLSAMARSFAERGWVAFSINYRLAKHVGTLPADYPDPSGDASGPQGNQWRALYPACRDAKAAIRWIRAHAGDYALATNFVTAIGGSAGSYLAVALAVTDETDCVDEVSLDADRTLGSTNLMESSRVQTIVDHWGGNSIVNMVQLMGGPDRFDATDAPVSIVHGTNDATVPFTQAEAIRDAYDQSGAPYAFYPLQGKGHGPWGAEFGGQSLTELAFDFIVQQQKLVVK